MGIIACRIVWFAAAMLVGTCLAGLGQPPTSIRDFPPVSDRMLQHPHPNDWLMWRRGYQAWGYSPLKHITPQNVTQLQLAWAWTTEPGNQEAEPLVYHGMMFLAQSRNVVQALEARTGDLIWEYRRKLPDVKGSYHRRQFERQRNSIALYANKVFLTTGDAHLVALDARTGEVAWEVAVADYQPGFNYTGGPLVVKGKVIAGMSGCTTPGTFGGCFITAHDADTGQELWRTHTIARPGDPAGATWNGLPLERRGGGSAWITGSYDPALNLIYWGSAPPIPHSAIARGTGTGAALYTNSTLALDVDTGKIVWYFQHHPGDHWNMDHAFERVLVDTQVGDRTRPLLLTVGKPGIVWALDRKTGEFLWAKETVEQNIISHIDARTGQVTLNDAVIPKAIEQESFVCPSFYGGKVWQAMAYSPLTNALYVPLGNLCMDYKVVEQDPIPGEDYGRGRLQMRHAPTNNGMLGRVEAIDVATGKTLWTHERRAYWSSALLTTGSGLIFGGDANRRLVAFDASNGRVLWETPLNGPISGFPMTYMIDGKQYLAVPTGPNLMADLAAKLTPEVRVPGRGLTLWVFALPDDRK